jgi:hypothetical protein
MDWQLALVALAVLGAVVYLGRQTWRLGRSKCGGGCGCAQTKSAAGTGEAPAAPLISADELTARARRNGSAS